MYLFFTVHTLICYRQLHNKIREKNPNKQKNNLVITGVNDNMKIYILIVPVINKIDRNRAIKMILPFFYTTKTDLINYLIDLKSIKFLQ